VYYDMHWCVCYSLEVVLSDRATATELAAA